MDKDIVRKVDIISGQCRYPEHLINPQNLIDFIQEDGFDDDWKSCGLNSDTDLGDFMLALCAMPESGELIPGGGGLRKIRWARPGMGKRGGLRVLYMWIPEIFMIYLFMAYPKSQRDDIGKDTLKVLAADCKAIRQRLISVYGY